ELLDSRPPLGTVAYVHQHVGRAKFDPKALQGTYMGVNDKNNTTIVLLDDGRVVESGHVTFGTIMRSSMGDTVATQTFETPLAPATQGQGERASTQPRAMGREGAAGEGEVPMELEGLQQRAAATAPAAPGPAAQPVFNNDHDFNDNDDHDDT